MKHRMTRREFFERSVTAGASAVAGPALARAAYGERRASPAANQAGGGEGGPSRPNLVYLFSDQQSFDMLGCNGNGQILTPNIDKAASEGVRFNHSISNSPLCTPYRGILMSGMHPLYSGALTNDFRMLPSEVATQGRGKYFGEALRDAGYRMGYIGKWHLYGGDRNRPIPPGPCRFGFDHTFLSNNCTLLFDKGRAYFWNETGQKELYGDWEPYGQARQAMKFIDENADRPFALFVSWHPPHNWSGEYNYSAPEELTKLYDPAGIRLRPSVEDTPQVRKMYRGYMAMCTSLDKAFGQILDRLKAKGLAENTIVVYTSDHGDTLRSRGWPGHKGCPQAEASRVPLILRYPGRLKPRRSDLLVGTFDLMPTLLGLMGLAVPPTCQGRDLSSAIAEGRDDAVESLPLVMIPGNWRGVYTRRHTYAFTVDADGNETRHRGYPPSLLNCLYDREADPHEMTNLFHSAEHRAVRQKLHEEALAWMQRFGDTGWPYRKVFETVLVPEDAAIEKNQGLQSQGNGRLKGRPIDLLGAEDR